MNFHQKLVVYYILDYFGILFILDINSVLIEFILWELIRVRFPPKSWEFFQPILLCFVLCYGFHVMRTVNS